MRPKFRDNATAIIGAAKVPEGTKTRLYIDCGNNASQIALGSGDTAANILADPVGKRVGIFSADSNTNVPNDSVALGMNQTIGNVGAVAVGSGVQTSTYGSGIGYNAKASGEYATAVGSSAKAANTYSTALGNESKTSGEFATAIGAKATAQDKYSVAIGSASNSVGEESICIGKQAVTNSAGSIAIGTGAKTTMGTGYGAPIAIGEKTIAGSTASIAIGSHINNSGYGTANRQTKASAHILVKPLAMFINISVIYLKV